MSGPRAWTAPGSDLPPERPAPAAGGGPRSPAAGGEAPADGGNGGAPPVAVQSTARSAGDTPAGRADLLGGEIAFRPLGVTEILDGSIACIRRHLRVVLGLSLLITAIIQVCHSVGGYLLLGGRAAGEPASGPLVRSLGAQATPALLGLALSAYGTLLLAGLLAPVVSRTLFAQPVSLRLVWRDVRPAFARLLAGAAAVPAAALLVAALPLLPMALLLAGGGPLPAVVPAGLLGLPVALGVLVWLYVLWAPAVPIMVLERRPIPAALRRARRLSRKRWWDAGGTLLLALLITIFMGFLALRLPFLLAQLLLFGAEEGDGAPLGSLIVDTLGRIAGWSLVTPFDAGVIALLYVDRRMRREGFDLDVQTRLRPGVPGPDRLEEIWRPAAFPAVPAAGAPREGGPEQAG